MPGTTQLRDGVGRFAGTLHSAPEVTLVSPSPRPGDRVTLRGMSGHRVISVDGTTFTLRPPHGGRVIAVASEVAAQPETVEEQHANLATEADIARLLVSVRKLSRQRRADLDASTGPQQRAALDALAGLYADGRLGVDQYAYVMRSTQEAPLGANHAALAITARAHLSAEHYGTLTAAARRAGAVLPA